MCVCVCVCVCVRACVCSVSVCVSLLFFFSLFFPSVARIMHSCACFAVRQKFCLFVLSFQLFHVEVGFLPLLLRV